MSVVVNDTDFTLYCGDVHEVLAGLPAESVHCCVTSPPYWGLRDYGTGSWEGGDEGCDHVKTTQHREQPDRPRGWDGPFRHTSEPLPVSYGDVCGKCGARRVDHQLGLEPTPEEYVANMVAVFREVRRVLRRDGTLWLNLGDGYSHGGNGSRDPEKWPKQSRNDHRVEHAKAAGGTKPKDLMGMPWKVAFALQADGWYLRSDIIWSKPNPMPESVTDRPTKAHEYLFLLTRSPRYYFDADAIREGYGDPAREWWNEARTSPGNPDRNDGGGVQSRPARGPDGRAVTRVVGRDGSAQHRNGERWPNPSGRNKRSVWEIATEPYPDAHFATFPQALVEPCVLAGTSERGCCPVCGAPWERETDVDYANPGNRTTNGPRSVEAREKATHATVNSRGSRLERMTTTTGWRPTCECVTRGGVGSDGNPLYDYVPSPVPCTVLDPFMGSGTTALVARRHGRRSIGIELNAEYAKLAATRLQQLSLLAEPA